MAKRAFVIGVGMSKFEKPKSSTRGYLEHGKTAVSEALADARMQYRDVDAVVASYCYGEPTCGQRVVYQMGLTGIPVFNVNNNCSSGSTALMLARSLVQTGDYRNVLAVGFEEMEGGLSERFPEKASPVRPHFDHLDKLSGKMEYDNGMNEMTNGVIRMFADAALEYMRLYPDTTVDDFVSIAVKNREMGRVNPRASFYGAPPLSRKDAKEKGIIFKPVSVSMCALTANGAAAAIVTSESHLLANQNDHVTRRAVEIVAQHMCTDLPSSFGSRLMDLCGYEAAARAAAMTYR